MTSANLESLPAVEGRFPEYNSDDMDYLCDILEDIVVELEDQRNCYLNLESEISIRIRLAAALFKAAETGERDYARLKQLALDAVASLGD